MVTKKIVKLMLKSSDNNQYTGSLSRKDNITAAIDLAKLCKEFADNGHAAEAMNVNSKQWKKVIGELEEMLTNENNKL